MSKSYTEMTIGDPNMVKRFLHRKRYEKAVELMPAPEEYSEILDFAAGNGQLAFYLLKKYPNIRITMFEPAIKYADEARKNTEILGNRVRVISDFDEVTNTEFSKIFCLSLLEHLAVAQQKEALRRIHSVSNPNTQTLVEVPNELYVAAAIKGLFRHHRRPQDFDGNFSNILRAVVGKPPSDRPIHGVAGMSADDLLPWHSSHLGFDHRILEHTIKETGLFEIDGPTFTPINLPGTSLDIYYLLNPATILV